MNRLTSVGLFDLWWLEVTAELGRELGTPRPFRSYLDAVMNVALMETIRKPPSRQSRLQQGHEMVVDPMPASMYFEVF